MSYRHVTTADHLFGSRTRARLLRILIFPDGRRVWVRELCRRVGTGFSSVQRELLWLRNAGLVRMHRDGGAAYYEAIEGHPLLEGLRRLLDSADDLDEHDGRWCPPLEEAQRRNQKRYREQQRMRQGVMQLQPDDGHVEAAYDENLSLGSLEGGSGDDCA